MKVVIKGERSHLHKQKAVLRDEHGLDKHKNPFNITGRYYLTDIICAGDEQARPVYNLWSDIMAAMFYARLKSIEIIE